MTIGILEMLALTDMRRNLLEAGVILVIGICILLVVSRPHTQSDKKSRNWISLIALFSGPAMVILWFAIEIFVVHRNNRVLAGDAWAMFPPVLLIATFVSVVAAIVISITDWTIVDPILGAAIGLFILPRAWRLGSSAIRILIQAAPPHLDLVRVSNSLQAIEGVVDVHDLHVWTLTSEMDVGTVHLMTKDSADPHPVLDEAGAILKQHGVAHATLQVEPESHQGCSEVTW